MVQSGPRLDDERRRAFGGSFQTGGEHYDRVRPGYPSDAVDWLLGSAPGASRAVDVGAGTGKYTAELLSRGLEVVAVDPSADMLAQLTRKFRGVRTVLGTAEHTGLPDASVDVATVAQAWHWVDPLAASTELARILRPGGLLGLVWNQLDVTVPWVHRLSRIMHAGDVHRPGFRPQIGPEFIGLQRHETRWSDPVTAAEVMELAKSRSYYLRAGEPTRAKVLSNLRWYLHDHLDYAGTSVIQLPYYTQTWRAFKA
ncbi:class I SAM-dependent methyltransferase [Arthrobacter mobilis]|uniref:Class I SAM-dependent methyltransferase n=1 Tax=Arthrobacter mobilis TaxID=2724944 RepID=A0A7X6HE36_9MICC|nr:class I SAM-dependent methyltransferase [Arthrobacter mobilis]NKX54513.1 class I SAM-dependent methyltransferase [Arthrobacter mobilis]